ncbi:helix-turn-helix domain-containing protein [Nonomuraea gerenzanensis]|uniref:helix-turn-helix domain-containing protein n=1 Tax=Nonomuraea gerenzanensis TaxID=93944 RepID=UPI001CD92809|nr:XRE family transcriptional regulator [Nonomuraea gerenzanensis]UBU13996.1 XRE family transcriptional regulator [Nonomuraea gerenzanensis]
MTIARQLRRRRKNELAREVGVTPAAITQYELGQAKPSPGVVSKLALALAMPADFFRIGHPEEAISPAHFRSLRATTQLERDEVIAFGKLAMRFVSAIERYVDLPAVNLPREDLPHEPTKADVAAIAQSARRALGVESGPIPHVIRLLESYGVVVLQLPNASRRVDAFSHWHGSRATVFMNPLKNDKPRSRFDAAHEAGHLIMHRDLEPGSRIIENQAHDFAAEFLAPAEEIVQEFPRTLDWEHLAILKRRWGISLKALVYRAHSLGIFRDTTYRRAMITLSQWGDPEPFDIGSRETPVLMTKAMEVCRDIGISKEMLTETARLPSALVEQILAVGIDERPKINLLIDNKHLD